MGILNRLKKFFGIGQDFNSKDYIDEKWLNPPAITHESYEIGASASATINERFWVNDNLLLIFCTSCGIMY